MHWAKSLCERARSIYIDTLFGIWVFSSFTMIWMPRLPSGKAFALHVGHWGSIPSRDRPKSLKRIGHSTAKCSATVASVTLGNYHYERMTHVTVGWDAKEPSLLWMAMSSEDRSIFSALHQEWWRLHMSEKFLSMT